MRKTFDVQLALGAVPIEKVEIPTKTRDELPPTLAGLQWIFTTPEVNREVFEVLKSIHPGKKSSTGRPGMDLWQILVLGVVRLTLNCNYDRLHHIANFDSLVRQLLGQPAFDQTLKFSLTALKENLPLLTEEHLEKVNAIVARHGRQLLQKKKDEVHQIKVDTYVLETNVHFPTDLNLAWDAARKIIDLASRLTAELHLPGWRKKAHWKRRIKGAMRACGRASKSGGANKQERLIATATDYLADLYELEEKLCQTLEQLRNQPLTPMQKFTYSELINWQNLLIKHIFLISDRLLEGRKIPAEEKLYSLFEQHTEWVAKGKSRPSVELGRRLLIASDQYHLIHEYKVMTGGNESAEVIPLIDKLLNELGPGKLASVSFDRGFSSVENRELLELYIPQVIMPKKGKLSVADQERQSEKTWRKLANAHSTVESNINSLEHHGLDRCPDKGEPSYDRYIGLGILSYNLHRIGNHLQEAEKKAAKRRKAS